MGEKIKDIHRAQLLTYMKLSGIDTGLLINFNVTGVTNGIQRFKLQMLCALCGLCGEFMKREQLSWTTKPYVTPPFDPLQFLEGHMRLLMALDPRGKIILHGRAGWSPATQSALWVRDTYDRLLRMQLDAPKRELRPSVRKLLAQGKIVIRGGRYVLP